MLKLVNLVEEKNLKQKEKVIQHADLPDVFQVKHLNYFQSYHLQRKKDLKLLKQVKRKFHFK